jgi:hypothetical protein
MRPHRLRNVCAAAAMLALIGLAVGCASYETGFFRYEDTARAPRQTDAPVELFGGTPERSHQEIGEVFAVGGSLESLDGIRASLLKAAASAGADAVVRVRVQPGWEPYVDYGPGLAVWSADLGGSGGCGWNGSVGWYPSGGRSRVVVRGVAVVWTGTGAKSGGE